MPARTNSSRAKSLPTRQGVSPSPSRISRSPASFPASPSSEQTITRGRPVRWAMAPAIWVRWTPPSPVTAAGQPPVSTAAARASASGMRISACNSCFIGLSSTQKRTLNAGKGPRPRLREGVCQKNYDLFSRWAAMVISILPGFCAFVKGKREDFWVLCGPAGRLRLVLFDSPGPARPRTPCAYFCPAAKVGKNALKPAV